MKQIIFHNEALKHYQYWIDTNNEKILLKISNLLKDIQEHPFSGLGKPEPLKGDLSGYWSRRINKEDRLVYKVENDKIIVVQCKFHY